MIPRFGDPPRDGPRYRHRMGAYAILPRQGQVLITHQQAPEPEFQLPGGGVDARESPLQALFREVREETGWLIARPRRLGAFRRFAYLPEYDMWAEKLCVIYLARPVRRLGPPTEAGHVALWSTPAFAARVLANPGDRHFLRAVMAGARAAAG
ncbi:MAG: NUDIX hydrolase [Roseovarius sp.]